MIKTGVFILAILIFICGCTYFCGQNNTSFYALIIGIDNYNDPRIPDLSYCKNDAKEILDSLLEHGWREEEITIYRDSEATKDAILSTLNSMVQRAQENDYIFVYYSGHGTYVSDSSGDEDDGTDEAIIPVDYNSGDISTLIFDDELGESFSECKTEKGIFIFDSCNSGGFINKALQGEEILKPRYIQIEDTKGSATNGDLDIINLPVMTASGQDESSYEDPPLQHGIFTYFLLDGIKNLNADRDSDNYITIRELFNYAEIHTESYTNSQHPQLRYPWGALDILITR